MKKFKFLALMLCIIFIAVGVAYLMSVNHRDQEEMLLINTKVSQTTDNLEVIGTDKREQSVSYNVEESERVIDGKKLSIADYEKWMIEPSEIANDFYKNRGDWALSILDHYKKSSDCFSVYNGETLGGDLLSSLIADKVLREALEKFSKNLNLPAPFIVYTQDYLIGLENKIVGKLQKDFYASSVCNAGKGVDVLTGVLLPRGTIVKKQEGAFYSNNLEKSRYEGLEEVLVVVNDSSVMTYTDIKLYDNTATGAEVSACKPSIAQNILTWTCFIGLAENGANYKDWEIMLDSGDVTEGKTYLVKS
jgi:hypothetical protein